MDCSRPGLTAPQGVTSKGWAPPGTAPHPLKGPRPTCLDSHSAQSGTDLARSAVSWSAGARPSTPRCIPHSQLTGRALEPPPGACSPPPLPRRGPLGQTSITRLMLIKAAASFSVLSFDILRHPAPHCPPHTLQAPLSLTSLVPAHLLLAPLSLPLGHTLPVPSPPFTCEALLPAVPPVAGPLNRKKAASALVFPWRCSAQGQNH